MRIQKKTVVALTVCALHCYTVSTDAYIDPGSTSLLLQWIVGGIAAGLILVANSWRRLSGAARHLIGLAIRRAGRTTIRTRKE